MHPQQPNMESKKLVVRRGDVSPLQGVFSGSSRSFWGCLPSLKLTVHP